MIFLFILILSTLGFSNTVQGATYIIGGNRNVLPNQIALMIWLPDCPCQYSIQFNIQGSSQITNATFRSPGKYIEQLVTGLNSNTKYQLKVVVLDNGNAQTRLPAVYTDQTSKDIITGSAEIWPSQDISSNQLKLNIWFNGCPCSYSLQYNVRDSSALTKKTFRISSNYTDQMVTGLESNKEYEFRVLTLSNSNGPTGWSATYTVHTSKDKITGPAEILGSTDVLSNQLSLTIQFDGCPCSYILQYNIQGSSEITNKTFGIFDNHTYQSVTGLKSNKKYEFRVEILSNNNGPTGSSAIYTVRTSKDIITDFVKECNIHATEWSSEGTSGKWESHYLSLHYIKCPANQGLRSFRLVRNITVKYYQYKYECCPLPHSCERSTDKNTRANQYGGGNMLFLDRHKLQCSNNYITSFRLDRPTNSSIQYKYKCCVLSNQKTCYSGSTTFTFDGNGATILLDRQNVVCKKYHHFLTSLHLVRDGTHSKIRYNFRCCGEETYCPNELAGTMEYKGVYSYDRSKTGTVITKNCTYGSTVTNKKSFIRECKPSESSSTPPVWTTPNLSHCLAKKKITQLLSDLENKMICGNVGQTNCISIETASSNLSSIISTPDVISIPEDVSLVSKIIENIAQKMNTTTTAEEAQTVLTDVLFVASEVSEAPPEIVFVAEETTQSADSMRNSIDVMGQHCTTLLQPGTEIKASSKDVGFVAAKVTRKSNIQIVSTVTNASTLIASLDENRTISESEVLALMNVPEQALPQGTNISVYSFTFRNNALFTRKESAGAKAASVILSATINNQKIQNLQTPINITFKIVDSSIVDKNPNCSFWNETNNFWSTDGLTKGIEVAGKSYLCQTNHLTNFALIIDIAQTQSNPLALQYITWIGCGISLAGLSLTVLSNCCLKKLRSKLVPRLLICLSLSLMCTILIFLFGVEETGSKLTSQVIAALLQYFLLVSFSWMAVQGFNLYSILFKTLERKDFNEFQFFIRSLIACTGIPAIVVIVTASVKPEDYGGANLCLVGGVSFYVTLLTPIALIIATNIVFLVLVLTELKKNYRRTKSMKNDDSDDEILKMAKITISCSILLGMTWVFGVLAVGKLTLVLQYLFCIFNSLQGFFIFVFYTLTKKEVRKEWKEAVGWKTLTTSSNQTTDKSRMILSCNVIQNCRGKELRHSTSSSA